MREEQAFVFIERADLLHTQRLRGINIGDDTRVTHGQFNSVT